MSYITFKNICKSYDNKTQVLKGIDLEVEEGELLTLLGPSGCGKSTLLRCLAGLEQVQQGHILLEGRDITDLDARQRQIGMVFQQYSLFPNMTVEQNMAFGLKIQRLSKAEINDRITEALAMVGLQDKADAYPAQLSGGQQQRVALARAIVTRPKVLLLDEPLSAIDAKLRKSLQVEIRRIQKQLNITTIFVTHDQDEAMVMSDRICLLNCGKIEQMDTPIAIYTHPRTKFAAGFIGLGIASICKGLGVEFVTELRWGTEDHVVFLWLLRVIFLGLFLAGVYLGCRKPKDYLPLLRHSGRSVADFILMDGAAPTLVNMALTGLIGHVYLLALSPFGVRLNGPLVCCVLSMTGFAAFGKHPKNVLPVMAGAVLAKSLLVAVPLTAPGSLLAVLFCTGLAPIAGQFGVFWGMVAGFLHMTIVQNTSILHGGMNLYNNGFAAGLVCVLLLPIIEAFQNRSKE